MARLSLCLRYGMIDIGKLSKSRLRETMRLWFQDYSEARVISKDTLALWKDLGSGSDVSGSARLWIRVMARFWILFRCEGEGQVDLDHHGVADINADERIQLTELE
ncbi:Tight Junction Protein Zo-3 [Manis pentadactyla]|nr:Tight Junction Protein Zo-3 [Manis pentadactyla]